MPRAAGAAAGTAGRTSRDEGSAIVEFVWLALLVMVPLLYVVLTAAAIQRAALGVSAAARDAGRAYATAGSDGLGERRAEAAAAMAMSDQAVPWQPSARVVSCGGCDYAPGTSFTVNLHTRVALPLLPSWLCGRICLAGVTVSAHHSERISCFAGTGTGTGTGAADPGRPC
jgi:hypothetical protein